MRQCPNCKTNNPDDARFCNYCGMHLPESKEELLYSDLEDLEETPKTEFTDQEIEEEAEKVIDEAQKLLNVESDNTEKSEEDDAVQEDTKEDTKQEQLRKQLTIPENLDKMIEEVTREEIEQELHRKIKLKEKYMQKQDTSAKDNDEEDIDEPTRMIGEKHIDETDEPTRMFTGDIGDFIQKKKEFEDVPEEDAYEEILQSWERKRKEKKIRRRREGKDTSRIPKIIRETRSWSDLTDRQRKVVKRVALGLVIFVVFCGIESYYGCPEAVAERYCKAYVQENWKKTGRLSDLPSNGYATMDEYVKYMKKNATTGVTDFRMKETKEDQQTEVESRGRQRALTVTYKNGKNKEVSETLILQKQQNRRLLLFADWKVSADEMIAKDFNIYLPSGSKAWIDGTGLTEEYKVKDDAKGLDQYRISLFEGKHKIKVNVPWFQPYKSEFQASDKGNTTISKMKISENGKKKLDKQMKQVLKVYIDAAKAGKSFSEVSGLLEQNTENNNENKEFYNDLKKALCSDDQYTTGEVSLSNYEGKYVISGVTGVVRGTLTYDYKVTYQTTDGEGTKKLSETADGSSQMSAEFVYKNGSYRLQSVDPGNIWYKEDR